MYQVETAYVAGPIFLHNFVNFDLVFLINSYAFTRSNINNDFYVNFGNNFNLRQKCVTQKNAEHFGVSHNVMAVYVIKLSKDQLSTLLII